MKVLDSTWFTYMHRRASPIGIVLGEDEVTGEYKAYIGIAMGESEDADIEYIMNFGAKFPTEIAKLLFGIGEGIPLWSAKRDTTTDAACKESQVKVCKSCGCSFKEEIKVAHDEHECALAMKEAKELENDELMHRIHLFDKKIREIAELLGVCYAGVDTDHDSIILAIKELQESK